jgi:filamentous hemagglutinin
MPVFIAVRPVTRLGLLATVSALALLSASPEAHARSLGGWKPVPSQAAVAAAQSASQEAAKAARQAQNALQRATRAIQAMQASQQAARDAARAALSNVPNGLQAGGLQVAPGAVAGSPLWQGAKAPTESTDGGRTKVTVEQTQQKAILTWQTFNVGKDTDLYFDQRAGGADVVNWVALNRVLDPSVAPSKILGSIRADGQVYVINRNGIIFSGSSQVNVQALIASSLHLSDAQFLAGIMNPLRQDIHTFPQFGEWPTILTGGTQPAPYIPGDVTVEAGARIMGGKQGLVALFGSNVTNRGWIETPSGQTLLAAGEIVYLKPTDATMVGLRAVVSARPENRLQNFTEPAKLYARTDLIGMNAINDGVIIAPEGNISIAGHKIVQNGILSATTTLNAAGSIELFAHDTYAFHPTGGFSSARAGEVIIGPNSITAVQIDRDPTVGTGGTAGDASFINIWGRTIWLQENALVRSEGGTVNITATGLLDGDFSVTGGLAFTPQPSAGARLLMGAGAIIDVAGAYDVEVPIERNFVEVEVRANELRDSPLQRDGILKGKKIWVDRRVSGVRENGTTWYGTEVVDANSYIDNVATSIAERATKGGTVTIHAGEVVMMPNALISIAGGSTRYLDGLAKTTKLLGADGRLYDIGSAPVDMPYVAIGGGFTRQNGRTTETWSNPLKGAELRLEKGYVEGADAGALVIHAPIQLLDGSISAHAIVGDRQLGAPPKGGSLTVGALSPPNNNYSPTNLVVGAAAAALPSDLSVTSALPADRVAAMVLTNDLFNESGFSEISIIAKQNVTLRPETDIVMQPGSELTLISNVGASSFVVDGRIRLPGGSVILSDEDGSVTVKARAQIDVSGQWTNLMTAPATPAYSKDAGEIVLGGAGLTLEAGVMLAADAGATLDRKGKVTTGAAGVITVGSAFPIDLNVVSISAHGLAISDQVPLAPAGGTLQLNISTLVLAPGDEAGITGILELFARSGFRSYQLQFAAGTLDNVTIAPRPQSRVLTSDAASWASADNVRSMSVVTTLAESRQRGVGIGISAAGDFVLGANAVIDSGIGGSVSVTAAGNLTVAGKIEAAAGSIALNGTTTTLAPTAQLLARGATRIVSDAFGLRDGEVLGGGAVNISGNINLTAGALIDVSGTSGTIDVIDRARKSPFGRSYRPLTIASDGGTITLGGTGLIASTLVANAGGQGAAGGSLRLGATASLPTLAAIPSTVYYQNASGVWTQVAGNQNLDIFDEFPGNITFAQSITTADRTKIRNAANGASGALLTIINDDTLSPGGPGWETYSLTLQEVDPTIVQSSLNAMYLYNKYFYTRSGSGTTASPFVYTKVNYSPRIQELVVRQSSFENGGFANVNLDASNVGVRFGEGVNIAASRQIAVNAALLTNFTGASASLTAPLVTFRSGRASVVANPSRAGTFSLHAQQIEVERAAFRGFADVSLHSAGDLIMSGNLTNPGGIYVDGALNLNAGQIYPTTQTTAAITATQEITVDQNGARPTAPLSAGGKLTLSAPTIEQNGTVRAPFGQITLDATTSLTLGPDSLTSVSGAGLTVPYGRIVDEVFWYAGSPNTPDLTPPEKRITLKAPTVDTQGGAVIDLSGGGDLLAYQFIPGSGGSSDYLTYGGAVAIMPISMVSNHVGKRIIHLDGGNGIPAGDYVVMPASYALLPGAYRMQAVTGSDEFAGSLRLPDGSVLVAGRGSTGGTDIRDQRTQAYKVSSIDTIRRYSEYKVWTANDYFRSNEFIEAARRQLGIEVTAVPRLPMDAGALQIQATLSATLGAILRGAADAGGRGAAIDVAAAKIAVVGGVDASSYQAAGYLVLDAAQLSAFGGESLLLGGTRLQTVSGLEVDALATSVLVATDGTSANALAAPEILLASEDTIQIVDGSRIEARGTAPGGSGNILIKPAIAAVRDGSGNVTTPARDFGAFVRVSNGEAARVIRDGAESTRGTLTVGAATLQGRALVLDGTKSTTVSASAALLGQVLDVTSSRISFGTPAGTPDGLILAGGTLDALLNAVDLRLRSYSSIDFYGNIALGALNADGSFKLGSLLLDAAGLNGSGAATVTVNAKEVVLTNTLGGTNVGLGGAGGTLAIAADTVSLGAGTKEINGFGSVRLSARSAVIGRGAGAVDFRNASVEVSAPLLTAESGASQDWATTGSFAVNGTGAATSFETLGARLAITGASITQGGLIDLSAGSLTLRATSGDVTLASGSVTRARGFTRTFYDQQADIAGGTVALVADQGAVQAQAGSLIDVSAVGNGESGTVSIVTPQHAAQLDGEMWAGSGGNFTLDTSGVASFATLAAKLNQGGFDGALSFRLRSGDVIVDGATSARRFEVAADAGSVTVIGSVDVSGAAGGTIRLSAKSDLTVGNGAVLRANASNAAKGSGLIELAAAEGIMDLRAGAIIESLGGRSGNGEIRLRFQRDDAAGTVKLASAAATLSAAKIVAEAYRAYSTTSVDAALPGALADAAAFMTNHAASIEGNLGRASDPTFHLVPGIELASAGDLTLASAVHLGGARYNGEAGVLTLRAVGNLNLNASLSDGFDSAAANAALQTTGTASWSYRLVGGADLGAASPLATQPIGAFAGASGNVRLASGTIVRTGTGSITVAAGSDVVLADQKAVIYTAGARVADPTLGGTYTGSLNYAATWHNENPPQPIMPVFTEGGGDIVVTAQNDVKTLVASDQMIVDWLWRQGAVNADGSFAANRQTAWWINFARFEQGIAALGGGNVTLTAGRDVVNTSAFTPTQGRVGGGRTAAEAKVVAITGGGDLLVKTGRDLVGGVYYVDKGTGTISAGGAITSNRMVSYDPDGAGSQQPRNLPIRTMLGLGDAAMTVTAGGTIDLGSASNPTLLPQADYQFAGNPFFPQPSVFSTYGESTRLELLSIGGDVSLWNEPTSLRVAGPAWASYRPGGFNQNSTNLQASTYYPARIKVIAAAGDVTFGGGMTIWPSASGNIDLWAQGTATLRTLVMSPSNPNRLGTILQPLVPTGSNLLDPRGGIAGTVGASVFQDGGLLHANDHEPSRIYANTGDINGVGATTQDGEGGATQYFSEQVWFRAGRDINNVQVGAMNNHTSDLTLFQAGRDVNLALGRITIDGPGFVLVDAGRDVFLGSGLGIQTMGNGETPASSGVNPPSYRNPYLPRKGADLVVMAGTADGPHYDDFVAAYLDPANVGAMQGYLVANGKPIYLDELTAFMRQVTGNATLSEAAAFAAFQAPRYSDYRKILIDRVLSRELRAAGRGQLDGLGDQGLGYERGYAALATLFPGAEQRGNTGWEGDVIMNQSMIRTYLGGDIDIVVPGGKLQVSALSSQMTGATNGVLTINGGEIRIATGLGTIINTSRVLTARGGDITIWSTFGDIDAGKGRKSSLTNPPRTYKLTADGNILYEVNPSFSGSGVSTQKGTLDAAAADVDLYAPNGVINAGDAGISVSGNAFFGALQILGADNIKAAGEVKGLQRETAPVNLTVESSGEQAAAGAARAATQSDGHALASIIIVEVIGFGGASGEGPKPDDDERRTREQRSYNPNSAVQFVGAGSLSEEQRQRLIHEGRL